MVDANSVVKSSFYLYISYFYKYYLGYSVPSSHNSHHHINCFPIDNSLNQPHLRSNDRYDYLLSIKQKNDAEVEKMSSRPLNRAAKRKLKKKLIKNKESERGILGPCVLRQLKYFDVGFSFLSDNLHNIYHGACVSSILNAFTYTIIFYFYLRENF